MHVCPWSPLACCHPNRQHIDEALLAKTLRQKLADHLGVKRLAKIEADELSPEEARRLVMEGSALEARGLQSVIREVARSHRPQQSSIAVIIQAPNLERLEERHQRRLLEIRAERISDGESQ